jgi:putative methyltransferase (TIGR04325 family)
MFSLYASLRNKLKKIRVVPIWDGIYAHYRDVPISGEGFDDPRWRQMTLRATRRVIEAYERNGSGAGDMDADHALLNLIAALVARKKGSVSILDFGGGLGVAYVHLKNRLKDLKDLNYCITEGQAVCQYGAELYNGDSRIKFDVRLPDASHEFDIIYISTALQYVEDYRGLLSSLCAYKADYFLMSNLSAGSFPTYATAQKNLPYTVLAYWFVNRQEIVAAMAEHGYDLIYSRSVSRTYDQSNFPSEYRMGSPCNLLFAISADKKSDGRFDR